MDGFDSVNPQDPTQVAVVSSGDRIPGIPEHLYKATIGVDLWKKVSLGFDGIYSGNQYLRGDEANKNNQLNGYWVFNTTAEYKVTKNFALFGKINNIFDTNYNSFGVYGNATGVLGPDYNDGRFVSPGAPRGGWIGVRLTM